MPTHSRKTILLAIDQQSSVLNTLDASQRHPIAYTAYGFRPAENGLLSLLGFNGELMDLLTGHYHLGNGYRQFNPVLMRFNSPDSWSPFGEGELNAYGYCGGDPCNRVDPTGHAWGFIKTLRKINILKKKTRAPKELEPYALIENPTTRFDKKVVKQLEKDFKKGKPSAEKIEKRENRYWAREIQRTGKTPTQIIERAEHRFKKNAPPPSQTGWTHIEDPVAKLAKLQIAEINTSKRILTDTLETRGRRQVILDNIRSDIAELVN
jgi:RHS repeat-associated protein